MRRGVLGVLLMLCLLAFVGVSFATTETRYMRSDYVFSTSCSSLAHLTDVSLYAVLGVKVYYDGVVVSGSVPVAQVNVPSLTTYVNGSWVAASGSGVSVVKVEVYGYQQSWVYLLNFSSNDLSGVNILSVAWTVHYHFSYNGILEIERFAWGSSTYNSCVSNFQYSVGAEKSWHGLTWAFDLETREWSGLAWGFDLETRGWHGAGWLFSLPDLKPVVYAPNVSPDGSRFPIWLVGGVVALVVGGVLVIRKKVG